MSIRIIQLIMSAIIGGIISYGMTIQLMPVADKVQILYVSQEEIMEYGDFASLGDVVRAFGITSPRTRSMCTPLTPLPDFVILRNPVV